MLKFTRSFQETLVRMIRKDQVLYYSAYDVATALQLKNKRRAVNEAVIMEAGSLLDMVQWENESVLFISAEYVIAMAWKAEWDLSKTFIKWLIENVDVAKNLHIGDHETMSGPVRNYFATTQIAKKYGLSGRKLNEILSDNQLQYKVNDQWVLYSKYQDLDLVKTIKIQKPASDEYVLHNYWTQGGVKFIESMLDRLGYKQQGEQLKLF